MTELVGVQQPAYNSFVARQMINDAREILNHINTQLNKWNLGRYHLSGEAIPFVIEAVRSFVDGVHDLADQKTFITEYGPIEEQGSGLVEGHLAVNDFLGKNLKNQFMQFAPRNVFRPETLALEPAVKILALLLLDKTIQRQQGVIAGRDETYQHEFQNCRSDCAFPLGTSFVKAIGQIYGTVDRHVTRNGLRADILENLARDFYLGEIPETADDNTRSVADGIATQLQIEMNVIRQIATSINAPIPAND